MAKDVIYIHDWWLSPELYLRRPPEGNQQWRIDRLLKRKAEEGVKIFIIVYRNVGQIIPIDSLYTKHSMLDLHKNIYFMRSPNQLIQNTYFWAHHEKLCLIDHTIAFVGGLDLCFGRWDTPDHVLVDDSPIPFHASTPNSNSIYEKNQNFQMWPGKDYSNPRQHDFFQLDKPYEDMYDRQEVPRMPWHDVHMMVTGQAARDASRHFVQRWNYLLRQKRPSRLTPMLLPPSDLTPEQIKNAKLEGSCEIQFLRSSCSWSLGLNEPEKSIQSAYLKAIEQSEHFVYIENQFFITSTMFENTKIENRIGDALVDRIITAHKNQQKWKAVIVIPLMPGFESEVDEKEGLSVRVIMQCQYLSINHGPNSIFGRLYAQGINPEDYIQFFSLRQWGKIGPKKKLVTEQLYIHSKAMVVDDRIAIIGSANINERSMRGTRDSEVAVIVRDTIQLPSTMGGKKFMVSKFAHTLRLRLMREHSGVDVDQVDMVERLVHKRAAEKSNKHNMNQTQFLNEIGPVKPHHYKPNDYEIELHSFNHYAGEENLGFREKKPYSVDSRVQENKKHKEDVDGMGFDGMRKAEAAEQMGYNSPLEIPSHIQDMAEKYLDEILEEVDIDTNITEVKRRLYFKLSAAEHGFDDSSYRFYPTHCDADNKIFEYKEHRETDSIDGKSSAADLNCKKDFFPVDPYSFNDPISDEFYYDMWERIADQNTMLYREIFHCQPDDEVTTWKHYMEFRELNNRFAALQGLKPTAGGINLDMPEDEVDVNGTGDQEDTSETGNSSAQGDETMGEIKESLVSQRKSRRAHRHRKSRGAVPEDNIYDPIVAEDMLRGVRGSLVFFPLDWLNREIDSGNWQHSIDHLPPLEIYD